MVRLLLLILAGLAVVAQTGGNREIPILPDGDHKGQPEHCIARDQNGEKKNCGICDRVCTGEHNDYKCKVYCRKDKCLCHPECALTGHHH